MICVLDASAAIEIVLQREAAKELATVVRESEWVIAPTLYISEIANVFWKYQKFADYSFNHCMNNIEQSIALPDDYINEIELYREAFNMGCLLDHPVYDMMYLVLARRNNAVLLTMDKKLQAVAQKSNILTSSMGSE